MGILDNILLGSESAVKSTRIGANRAIGSIKSTLNSPSLKDARALASSVAKDVSGSKIMLGAGAAAGMAYQGYVNGDTSISGLGKGAAMGVLGVGSAIAGRSLYKGGKGPAMKAWGSAKTGAKDLYSKAVNGYENELSRARIRQSSVGMGDRLNEVI